VALMIPVGYGVMLQMSGSNTLIQSMVPDKLRGRAMAVYTMMFMGMAPLGSLFAGAVAEKIGAPWTVAIGGAGAIAGAYWFLQKLPEIQREARELIAAQGLGGGDPPARATAG
jgi:MFS family permease